MKGMWNSDSSVRKVLLKHIHGHFFTFVYDCFPITRVNFSSYDKDITANKAKNIFLICPFTEKVCQPLL